MGRQKAPAWTQAEIESLRSTFPGGGINAAAAALPARTWQSINTMASKLGIVSGRVANAPRAKLDGGDLEEAIRLREVEGWSFARIGATYGVSESAASNAILIALCPRKGFTPAQRDAQGRLAQEGLERLRLALRRGIKPVDIQLKLGVSASCIAEQRRRYSRELKAAAKVALPPPGAGEAYSGRKVPAEQKAEVERLLLTGLGGPKVAERTGISKTHVQRVRMKLVKKLARKGEVIPGCDIKGRRLRHIDAARFIPDQAKADLRAKLLARIPVRRAANDVGIGLSSAYRMRDDLAAELAAQGEELPKPILPGRGASARSDARRAEWMPKGIRWLYRFRALSHEHGAEAAKAMVLAEESAERRAEAARPKTFEEQLAAVRAGKVGISTKQTIRSADPTYTLGGIATGAL